MKNLLSENAAILIIGNEILSGRTEDKNFNLNFFEIIFAPVDFPVAAPPSQDIWNFLFLNFKFSS